MSIKEFDGGLKEGNQEVTIGIDQSLTGFALSVVSVEFPNKHMTWVYKSEFRGVQRLVDIYNWLDAKFTEFMWNGWDVKDAAMEGTVLASHSALALGELAAVVKLVLWYKLPEPPLQIPPMTLKKYATGKGTSKKQEMLLQIYKRWGIEFNDDNAADAYALARLASGSATGAIELETQEKIKDPKYRDFIQ
jgi:Holliday junction resolvasome RuvABC endonuclease subunit